MRGLIVGLALAATSTWAAAEDWNGFYAGVIGGYGDGKIDAVSVGLTRPISGGLLGATAGYRFAHGPVVLGVEGDLSWADLRYRDASGTFTVGALSTLRFQVGAPIGWALPYVTAGAAVGTGRTETFATGLVTSNLHFGAVAGVGIEVAVTDMLSIKAEHLRVGLGPQNYAQGGPTSLVGFDLGVTRIGLNARF